MVRQVYSCLGNCTAINSDVVNNVRVNFWIEGDSGYPGIDRLLFGLSSVTARDRWSVGTEARERDP
jgi:hypothetical protein